MAERGGDAHRHARELHDKWLAEGIVVRDAEPSLYPYLIELKDGGLRRGLCALVGVRTVLFRRSAATRGDGGQTAGRAPGVARDFGYRP